MKNEPESGFYGNQSVNEMLEVIDSEGIGKIISVSFPFAGQSAGYKIKKRRPGLKRIVYEFDPYICNYIKSDAGIARRKRKLTRLYSNADLIISTDGIAQENARRGFRREYDEITHSVPLPNFMPSVKKAGSERPNDGKIHLVYTGVLYEKLREPSELLRLLERANDGTLVCDIFGRGCENTFGSFELAAAGVVHHGYCGKQVCERALESADILINIANDIPNQTPSKVFEYLACGKPIINFYYRDEDICTEYFSHYPLCLQIRNDAEITPQLCNEFLSFCRGSVGRQLTNEQLMKLYPELLSDNVCKLICGYILSGC